MPDAPNLMILDRESARRDAQEHFGPQLELLEQMTNYGTNLILRLLRTSERGLVDLIVIAALGKQAFTMLDGCSVLLASGAAHAAFLPVRALFESSVHLQWILSNHSERRARAYFVANLRQERIWCLRVLEGTPEYDRATVAFSNSAIPRVDTTPLQAQASDSLDKVDRLLLSPENAEMNAEFEVFYKRRGYDPSWNEVAGEKSLRKITESIQRLAEYEIIYSPGSEVVHGSSFVRHFTVGSGRIALHGIRGVQDAPDLVTYAASTALHTIQILLQHYRPDEIANFGQKYLAEWRGSFMSIPKVVVEPRLLPLDPI